MHRRLPDGVGFGVPSDLAIFSVRDQFLSAKHAVISGHHSADGRFKVISTHECSVFSFACLDLVPLPATYELILALAINVERVEVGEAGVQCRRSVHEDLPARCRVTEREHLAIEMPNAYTMRL